MRSSVEKFDRMLHRRWIPKWYESFSDNVHQGFHERLDTQFQPLPVAYKRLVTQCRQIAVFSQACIEDRRFKPDIQKHFDFLVKHYRGPHDGGWYFSVTPEGMPYDTTYDLYGHSFVIFMLCLYSKAFQHSDGRLLAEVTLNFVRDNFRLHGAPGYTEALNQDLKPLPRVRRQDPHMHLLEACLFACETGDENIYRDTAEDLIDLFLNHFITPDRTLIEYFDDNLAPHSQDGHKIKPGHYFEWVWLLRKYIAVLNPPESRARKLQKICTVFLEKGNRYGYDTVYGGIYDYIDPDGRVIEDTKRIWPFAEALKANAMMLDSGHDKVFLKDRVKDMIAVFNDGYMEERGFWTETLNRDLSPATDYMPGTTPYHLYFGITETLRYLKSRGPSKSLIDGPAGALYNMRRSLSAFFKSFKRIS